MTNSEKLSIQPAASNRVRRESIPMVLSMVSTVLAKVPKVPHIILPTGSTVFNGEGNDYDVAVFCGAAPRHPGDSSVVPGMRASMGRAMITAALRDAGFVEHGTSYHYEGGADIRSFRAGSINVILYNNPDEWNAMKKAHEACVAAAAVQKLTKNQRDAIFMAVRDGWDALTIGNYLKASGQEDYI